MVHRRPHSPSSLEATCSSQQAGQKTEPESLIKAFDELLEEASAACKQSRSRERLRSHLLAQLACFGEHTVSGILCALGQQFQDWTAAYRFYSHQRVDPQPLFCAVRRQIESSLPPSSPLVVALDDSLLRKRGRKIPGATWRVDPLGPAFQVNFVWAQRVVQLAAALPYGSEGAARTVPIDFAHAPSAPRPRKGAPPQAWDAYREEQKRLNLNSQAAKRLHQLTRQLVLEGQTHPLWVTVDGGYTNKTFLKQAPAEAIIIGRVRKDSRLHEPVNRPPGPAGGRPRRYGTLLPTPEALRKDEHVPWQEVVAFAAGKRHMFKVKTLGPVLWRVTGTQRLLRLIVLAPLAYRPRKGSHLLYRKPAYLICTDPNLSLEEILQAYLWRWGIEVNFRDEKTLLGVGQARVRNPHASHAVPAVVVAAYALLLAAADRARLLPQLPLPAWQQVSSPSKPSTGRLINQLRYELWTDALRPGLRDFMSPTQLYQNSHKPAPHLESSVLYASAG
jgi:hypothetical protein